MTDSAKCPKCELIAQSHEEIETKFGWRESGDKIIPQSWCRRCRSGKPSVAEKEKEIDKQAWSRLQSYANRLRDVESLRHLFTKPDALNYDYANSPLSTDNWSKEAKRILSEIGPSITIIAKKCSFDIIYIEVTNDDESKWKKLASEVFSKHAGHALVVSHNPLNNKWMFTGNSGKGRSSTKHISIYIDDQNVPQTFINWLYKIRADVDDVLLRILGKMDIAFDNFALDIQDQLGDNVFEAFKILIEEAVFNKDNKIEFSNQMLKVMNEPLFTLLYRIVFALYAESRDILNTNNKKYYDEFSLKKIVVEYLKNWKNNSSDTSFKEYEIWHRLQRLFRLIEMGSKSLQIETTELEMPAYDGSLFNSDLHPELDRWKFHNDSILNALHNLTRIQDKEKNWSFVNYSSIEIRHIGTIYEKLLEFHPEKIGNKIEIFTHDGKRESAGTYYTPKFIVDNIVENALGPIIDEIIRNTPNKDEQVEKILSLKILDPAMGSGHFLVGVADYMTERILEIEGNYEESNSIIRKRQVVRQCLYGVDISPLAVELAKMSLWLDTLSNTHALSFLSTHLKNGDSIISAWRTDIFDPQTTFGDDPSRTHFRDFVKKYSAFETIDDHLATTVRAKIEDEMETRKKGSDYDHLKYLFDVQLSKYFGHEIMNWRELRSKVGKKEFDKIVQGIDWSLNRQFADQNHFFHWELEFPQIFFDKSGDKLQNPGFDIIIGNPPYGVKYDNEYFASFNLGSKESYGFFMFQCTRLLKNGGVLSMVVSDTWRTIGTHLPLRSFILENMKIKRLIKLSRYAFKTFGRNIDAFTIIVEFEKSKDENNSYYYYDFWQIHPLNEREYFNNVISHATYLEEGNEWPYDQRRTKRYQISQRVVENIEFLPIFEGDEGIAQLFNKKNPIKYIEI